MQLTWIQASSNKLSDYRQKQITLSIFKELVNNTNQIISRFCSSHTCSGDTAQVFTPLPQYTNGSTINTEAIKQKLNYFDTNYCNSHLHDNYSGYNATQKSADNTNKFASELSGNNSNHNIGQFATVTDVCDKYCGTKYQCITHKASYNDTNYNTNDSSTCGQHCNGKNLCTTHMSGQRSTHYSQDNSSTYTTVNNVQAKCVNDNSTVNEGHYTNKLSTYYTTNNSPNYACSTNNQTVCSTHKVSFNSSKNSTVDLSDLIAQQGSYNSNVS